ncbi:hypothetical protein BGX31_002506 [Mortierella sp. GBA43]|nr:hypothetical protein BGX31_002506 [Mortierella sp. GBA43]
MGPAMVGVSNAAVGPEGPVFHEKSPWLRKENKKRSQMRKCLCLAVILCFLILGAVLAFCYREQIFTVGHQQPSASLGAGTGGGGAAPKGNVPQTIEAIESLYHVNKTIIQDEGLHKVFYGIDYTPRGSQEPDCKVDLGQVIEDMKVLSQLTNRIRLYGMACQQTETVFKALEYLELSEMQVVVTLWVDHDKNTWEKQQRAFWNLIDHDMNLNGNANKNNNPGSITISRTASKIMGVSVGNEVLFRNEEQKGKTGFVPINLLENYIQEIRQGLAQRASSAATAAAAGANGSRDTTMAALAQHLTQIPVFSSDLGRNAHQIVDSVDWVMSNIHPFFANTAAEDAADWTFSNFKTETVQAAGKKPAIISEVGWPSGPSSASMGSAVPSRENLQTFLDTWVCQANKRNVPYYYFEAFDEPWKSSINPREAQWGIMTVDRKLKVTIPTC